MRRIALDTNLLVYLEGHDDPGKTRALEHLFSRLSATRIVVPVQVLGELHRVLVRKHRKSPGEATAVCAEYSSAFEVRPTSAAAFERALLLAAGHGVAIWDAVILSVAAEAECDVLLSEDVFYNGTIAGVIIINPFTAESHPLLRTALGD